MTEKEYLEELKKDKEFCARMKITANLNAIILILKTNGLTTEEEYEKLVKESEKVLQKVVLQSLTDEQKKGLETSKGFRDLFGKGLEDFI